MARKTDPTKFLCGLEELDFTNYDKGVLTDVQLRLTAILAKVDNSIAQYDYNVELATLKKKYGIKD